MDPMRSGIASWVIITVPSAGRTARTIPVTDQLREWLLPPVAWGYWIGNAVTG